jgi:sphingosine kinase
LPYGSPNNICRSAVQPMLEQAGDVCVTTHPFHALERCLEIKTATDNNNNNDGNALAIDITKYGALVLMGGDGIIHEVLNGMQQRSDIKLPPIGVIGCGTANGMATTLTYASQERYGVTDETFLIAKGRTVEADLSNYEILDNASTATNSSSTSGIIRKYTSFLNFSWAIFAEIDIESERIHWLGAAWFDVWAALCVLLLCKYGAKLSYLPATSGVGVVATAAASDKDNSSNMPALDEPVSNDWKVIEDDIVLLWVLHVTHVCA